MNRLALGVAACIIALVGVGIATSWSAGGGTGSPPLPTWASGSLPAPSASGPSTGHGPSRRAGSAAVVPPAEPTPRIGVASWYDDGPGLYAAVPSWSWGDEPYKALVCRNPGSCVTVTVRDFCACYVGTRRERIIDLSPAAFAQLAPLSRGLVEVVVAP